MAREGLVPKKTIATRADGSTYETTVHVRPGDDAATNFKVANGGVPVSSIAGSGIKDFPGIGGLDLRLETPDGTRYGPTDNTSERRAKADLWRSAIEVRGYAIAVDTDDEDSTYLVHKDSNRYIMGGVYSGGVMMEPGVQSGNPWTPSDFSTASEYLDAVEGSFSDLWKEWNPESDE